MTGAPNTKVSASVAPTPERPEQIRNVVLVGHSGSGKTALFERIIADHVEGYRAKDSTERSVGLSVASFGANDKVINLIDAPGYPDYVGELRAGLRAADAALFVISAADGIDGSTSLLWQECAAVGMPRAVVVTKLEAGRASYDDALALMERHFGAGVKPLYQPVVEGETVTGNVGLLTQKHYDYRSGQMVEVPLEGELADLVEERRGDTIEGIITESEDDTLLERYLEGEAVELETVYSDLLKATERGSFYPVIPVSAPTGVGIDQLITLISVAFPPPNLQALRPITTPDGESLGKLPGDPEGSLVAQVVRTTTDSYVGRLSLVRVFNGTLRPEMTVHTSGRVVHMVGDEAEYNVEERIGPLSSPLGDQTRPKDQAVAGDIVLVAKLARAETGDTLSDKDRPALVQPWMMTEPLLPTAIRAATKNDEDKLANALPRLVAEDPSIRLEHSGETKQVVLWTMGQAHLELLMGRLKNRFGVDVVTDPLRVPLRETFTQAVTVEGKHKKQSGGHGQYAVCNVTFEPLERGGGYEFVDKVVGGAVPRNFIPSVDKGVQAQMGKGALAGYPLVDLRCTLFDGKAHSVDSSDMAFQTAAALALKEAAAKPGVVTLLEPIDAVTITVSDEHMGAVMTDLQGRRGRVLGTDTNENGWAQVKAEIPAVELTRYAIDLRSLSQGTGTFTREELRYDPMPEHVAQKVLETNKEPQK